MKNDSVIPPGGYCYRVRKIGPDEVLSTDIDRFGKDLREFAFADGYKEILCPYWRRTDYGMVRCEFLDIEGLDEMKGAREKALTHYGTEEAFFAANRSPNWLPDEIKVCGVNEDQDNDGSAVSIAEFMPNKADCRPSWRVSRSSACVGT